MIKNREIKGLARENLLNNYAILIAANLITTLIILICMTPFTQMMTNGLRSGTLYSILIGLAGSIIVSLVSGLFIAGINKMHLDIARGNQLSFSTLLYPFKNRPDRFIAVVLIITIISFACEIPGFFLIILGASGKSTSIPLLLAGILCTIAGSIVLIIIALGFSMAEYLLLDDPSGLTAGSSLKNSWRMMKRQKGKFFGLCISFIGWMLLGMLSFGIADLWISQYLAQSQAVFYLQLTSRNVYEASAVPNE